MDPILEPVFCDFRLHLAADVLAELQAVEKARQQRARAPRVGSDNDKFSVDALLSRHARRLDQLEYAFDAQQIADKADLERAWLQAKPIGKATVRVLWDRKG